MPHAWVNVPTTFSHSSPAEFNNLQSLAVCHSLAAVWPFEDSSKTEWSDALAGVWAQNFGDSKEVIARQRAPVCRCARLVLSWHPCVRVRARHMRESAGKGALVHRERHYTCPSAHARLHSPLRADVSRKTTIERRVGDVQKAGFFGMPHGVSVEVNGGDLTFGWLVEANKRIMVRVEQGKRPFRYTETRVS